MRAGNWSCWRADDRFTPIGGGTGPAQGGLVLDGRQTRGQMAGSAGDIMQVGDLRRSSSRRGPVWRFPCRPASSETYTYLVSHQISTERGLEPAYRPTRRPAAPGPLRHRSVPVGPSVIVPLWIACGPARGGSCQLSGGRASDSGYGLAG